MSDVGMASLGVGLVVSFFVAWGVIATFITYLKKRGLEPFGWYRIVLGAVVLAWPLPDEPPPSHPAAARARTSGERAAVARRARLGVWRMPR